MVLPSLTVVAVAGSRFLMRSKLVSSSLNPVIVALMLASSPSRFVNTWNVTGLPMSPLTAVVPNLVTDFSSMLSNASWSDAVSKSVSRSLRNMLEASRSKSNNPAPPPISANAPRRLHSELTDLLLVAKTQCQFGTFDSARCDTLLNKRRASQQDPSTPRLELLTAAD